MKSILIIGGSGFVGSVFTKYFSQKYSIHVTYNKNKLNFDIPSSKIDLLENKQKIQDLILNLKPDIIFHTVAYPSVDFCEQNHESTDDLHVDSIRKISNVAKTVNSKLIFLSTDAVFNSIDKTKFNENDKTNPINYYGKSKLSAEKIVLNSSEQNVVLRTSVIYGWHKKSRFTNWIISSLENNKTVDPFVDQYNSPTLVDDLVMSIQNIIEKNISGLFHATGKTCLNRYEFALIIADVFNLDKNLIKPVTKLEKKQDAPRPFNSCLDSSKLEDFLDFEFSDIKKGVNFILTRKLKSEENFS
jgi:dTDP-4-dehydrorhamnose reductase